MRLYNLGVDYSLESSIRYRINHKEDLVYQSKPTHKFFDLHDNKYAGSKGLQRWMLEQNLDLAIDIFNKRNEIYDAKSNKSLKEQIEEAWDDIHITEENLIELEEKNKNIRNAVISLKEFPNYKELTNGYFKAKNVSEKEAKNYKKIHYKEYLEYDRIIKNLKPFMKKDVNGKNIYPKENDLENLLRDTENDYNDLYEKYNSQKNEIANLQRLYNLDKESQKYNDWNKDKSK